MARRSESALALALRVSDDIGSLVAASRLTTALRRARAALDATLIDAAVPRADVVAVFRASTQGMRELLRRAPTEFPHRDSQRLVRWVTAPRRSESATCGPDLYELDVTGIPLVDTVFPGLHVVGCRFITDMHGASFLDALIERTDFTYSNLNNTRWQATQVRRSFLRDSSLAGARFAGTTFIDCNLRRADFSIAPGLEPKDVSVSGVEFTRCDLRGVNWSGRDLSQMKMIDCELDGLRGADSLLSHRRNCVGL